MEMHMIHIEDKYINKTTKEYDWDGALADPKGVAVMDMFFRVDATKPQRMEVVGEFSPRGGISLTTSASYPDEG